ncbi:hypothetical protein C2E23DRAFT_686620, partial [Lenzites betulinus]
LEKFVSDPPALRSMMRAMGAVISGSFALHFLDRDRQLQWCARDLDIYVGAEYGCRLVYYLMYVEHYGNLRHKNREYPHSFGGFRTIVTLSRHDSSIDIVFSTSSSPLLPIAHFWGSHVVNYIAADTFCLAYPTFTLEGRGLLHPERLLQWRHTTTYILTLIEKYVQRGYDFRIRPTA